MTKSYSVLQARLEELESKLNEAWLLPQDTESHIAFSQELAHKFAFVGKLLSAEAASHPWKPHHLHHIAEKLARLETNFCDWIRGRAALPSDHQMDNESLCSCTESCLNADGDAGFNVLEDLEMFSQEVVNGDKKASMEFDEPEAEKFSEGFDGIKTMVDIDGESERKKITRNFGFRWDEIEREEIKSSTFRFGKLWLAMSSGVVLGMVLMGYLMIKFSGSFNYVEQTSYLIPT